MCQHNSNCGCGCTSSCGGGCCSKTKSDNIQYSGPNLSCLNINIHDDLTTIIQILTTAICSNTTTSTTTSSGTTTTTTTLADFLLWEAKVSQEGTNAPTITLVKSTMGETSISSQIVNSGNYKIILNGLNFSLDPTRTLVVSSNSIGFPTVVNISDSSTIGIDTDGNNDVLYRTTIMVKHYLADAPQPPISFAYNLSTPNATSGIACSNTNQLGTFYADMNDLPSGGALFFNDPEMTSPFNGADQWYAILDDPEGRVIQIDSDGNQLNTLNCF